MEINLGLFLDILGIDSTSGKERALADYLAERLAGDDCRVSRFPADAAPGEPVNLLFSWGNPKLVYCTHLDTVPPYIAPAVVEDADGDITITGRGACDAKGQIISMYTACAELARQGCTDFGLLLLYGEETGSYGAKEYRNHPGAEYVVVGEPTDNCMVSACKGTKSFAVTIDGRSFHSGYPQFGVSAVNRFVDFVNSLREVHFPVDPLLGDTTWNIGALHSDNPQNILSPRLTFRIYFRTTFMTDKMVSEVMSQLSVGDVHVEAYGGDTPMSYFTIPGFPQKTVSFGSDAPQLTNFEHRMLCGPGSILVAHRDDEKVKLSQLTDAVENYIKIYHTIQHNAR